MKKVRCRQSFLTNAKDVLKLYKMQLHENKKCSAGERFCWQIFKNVLKEHKCN